MSDNYKNKGEKKVGQKRVMIISTGDKDWSKGDFYPMQNWSPEDRQLWVKLMVEKKNQEINKDSTGPVPDR